MHIIALQSSNYLYSANEVTFESNWKKYEGWGGLSYDNAILRTDKNRAKIKVDFSIPKEDKYAIWLRFQKGPSLGEVKIVLDGYSEYIINQSGSNTSFCWVKISTKELKAKRHSLEIINKKNKSVTFDSIYITDNLFFEPKVNRFNTDVVDDKMYNVMYNLLIIFIGSLVYSAIIYLLKKTEKSSSYLKRLFFRIKSYFRKNIPALYGLGAVLFISCAFIFESLAFFKLADMMGVCAYFIFTLGVIEKLIMSKN